MFTFLYKGTPFSTSHVLFKIDLLLWDVQMFTLISLKPFQIPVYMRLLTSFRQMKLLSLKLHYCLKQWKNYHYNMKKKHCNNITRYFPIPSITDRAMFTTLCMKPRFADRFNHYQLQIYVVLTMAYVANFKVPWQNQFWQRTFSDQFCSVI
jgi:hypothetical protein